MKIKLIFLTVLLLFSSINIFSQLTITSEKVTYQRKGQDLPDYKKSFEIIYPRFSGIDDPKVKQNLEDTLSYWNNFEMNLEEELGEFQGLDAAEYIVNYNNKSVLDMTLVMDVSGAYPSTLVKNLVVDLKTGKRIFIKDAFTNIKQLYVKIDKARAVKEKEAFAELKKHNPEDLQTLKDALKERKFDFKKLEEFTISETGVSFLYDYEFPHVIMALQPVGTYFFTWAEIKPYIKQDGLLGQFIR